MKFPGLPGTQPVGIIPSITVFLQSEQKESAGSQKVRDLSLRSLLKILSKCYDNETDNGCMLKEDPISCFKILPWYSKGIHSYLQREHWIFKNKALSSTGTS